MPSYGVTEPQWVKLANRQRAQHFLVIYIYTCLCLVNVYVMRSNDMYFELNWNWIQDSSFSEKTHIILHVIHPSNKHWSSQLICLILLNIVSGYVVHVCHGMYHLSIVISIYAYNIFFILVLIWCRIYVCVYRHVALLCFDTFILISLSINHFPSIHLSSIYFQDYIVGLPYIAIIKSVSYCWILSIIFHWIAMRCPLTLVKQKGFFTKWNSNKTTSSEPSQL